MKKALIFALFALMTLPVLAQNNDKKPGIDKENCTFTNTVAYNDNSGNVEGHIYSVQPSGSETLVQVKVNDTILLVKEIGLKRYQEDQKVSLTVHSHLMTVYSKETGRLLKYAIEIEEDLNQ